MVLLSSQSAIRCRVAYKVRSARTIFRTFLTYCQLLVIGCDQRVVLSPRVNSALLAACRSWSFPSASIHLAPYQISLTPENGMSSRCEARKMATLTRSPAGRGWAHRRTALPYGRPPVRDELRQDRNPSATSFAPSHQRQGGRVRSPSIRRARRTLMSHLGHSRYFDRRAATSGLPQQPNRLGVCRHVSKVPKALNRCAIAR
jgi:hypothetical protein